MDKLDCILSQSSGFCVRCTVPTQLVCHRCGDFYCCKKCQLQDWQRHRYICFAIPALVHPLACSVLGGVNLPIYTEEAKQEKTEANPKSEANLNVKKAPSVTKKPMPAVSADKSANNNNSTPSASSAKMQDINGTNKKLTPKNTTPAYAKKPPNNSVVCVQGFRFPNRCFIRELTGNAEKAYLHISEQLILKVEELPKVTKLRCHQYALAHFKDKLHRVKVLEVQNYTLARLAFLDLGIVKMHKMNEMYEISSELLGLTCYTMLMQLKDVPNYTMGEDVSKFLAQFTDERFQITYGSKGCVELNHVNTKLSLNEQIRQFCAKRQVFDRQPTAPSLPKLDNPIQADPQTNPAKETIASQIKHVQECQSAASIIADVAPMQQLKTNEHNSLEVVEPKFNKAQTALQALELQLMKKATLHTNEVTEEFTDQAKHKEEFTDQAKLKEEFTDQAKLNAKAKDVPIDNKENQISYQENFNKKNDHSEKNEINVKPITIVKPVNDDSIVSEEIIVNTTKSSLPSPKSNPIAKPMNNDSIVSEEINVNVAKSSLPLAKPKADNPSVSLENVLTVFNSISSSTKEQRTKDQQVFQPILHPPFELRRLSRNKLEGLDVFIVDNTNISRGIIGAFDSESARDFSNLHFRLSAFKDSEPYTPVAKEYVIAKYEGTWYRAKVLGIKKSPSEILYNVVYLEFTNVATLSEENIRRYPADLTIPCHTNVCLIEGFPHRPTTAQIKYLEEHLEMHSLLHVDNVNYLQDMALIKCNALMQALSKLSK